MNTIINSQHFQIAVAQEKYGKEHCFLLYSTYLVENIGIITLFSNQRRYQDNHLKYLKVVGEFKRYTMYTDTIN